MPNIQYFRDHEIFVENLVELGPLLSWDLILGTTMKWLLYDDPVEEYSDKNPHIKFRMILLDGLGAFLNLKLQGINLARKNLNSLYNWQWRTPR